MIYEPQSWLEFFFIFKEYPINAERGHYVLSLVFLSFAIASIGAFTSLKVIQGLLQTDREELRPQLHFIGAACLSATIWSMHFIGMIAYDMDMAHSYNFPITFFSMLIAAAVAYGFIAIIRFRRPSLSTYCLGAVSLGLAICMMHYSGMLAMEMDAKLLYRPSLFILSVFVALSASALAMWLVYRLGSNRNIYFLVLSSVLIGSGICGLHYTGMMATVFLPYADCLFTPEQTHYPLAFTVTAISCLVYIFSYFLMNMKLHGHTLGLKKSWSNFTPVLLFITGISIVTVSVVVTEGALQRQANQRFLNLAHDVEDGLLDKYALYEQALYGGLGLYEASSYVSHEEWKLFSSVHNVTEKLKGINGIGFIRYLDGSELFEFSKQYEAETGQVFRVHPETSYDNKFVIQYIEPMELNKEAVGLDIGFEENRREAAERAMRTGLPALTNKIELVQDNEARAGFLLLVPFFKGGQKDDLSGVAEKEIYGWVYAPFIGENFLKDLTLLGNGEITFAVYDGEKIDERHLIYKDAAFNDAYENKHLSRTMRVVIAGQSWSIVFKSTLMFETVVKSYLPFLQAIVGLIITMLLSFITYNQNTREQTVKNMVKEKTRELQALSESLEETVQERTSALKRASQAKDMFLANMSHELRTPLNSILGLTRMLLDEKDIPEDHLQTLQTVGKASSSLLSIVNDVLDISKIEAEMIELEQQPFELNDFILSVVDQLKPLASQKGLVFKDNIATLPETIVASDKLRLSRIILNLGSNATKYTLSGGVSVDVSLLPHSDDGYIYFQCRVSDTGIGIADNKIEHIFEKFTQAEESTERNFGGTGLGLNITKQLVELMGGTIGVKSKLNEGSAFTVKIPLKLSTEEALNAENSFDDISSHHSKDFGKRKLAGEAQVLIAEDHEFNQIFILKLLKQFGFKAVTLVTNGAEAVDKYRGAAYDIVLMDCHMPKLNGYDATQEIRVLEQADEGGGHIPIFAMTADAMVGTKEKCLEAGMDEYITKPIDSDVLKKHLEAYFIIGGLEEPNVEQDFAPVEPAEENTSAAAEDALLDLGVLLEYTDNDMDGVKELIALFYESSLSDLDALKDNITGGENEEWSSIAHRLKGSAAYIGAERYRMMCADAQNMKNVSKEEREGLYLKIRALHTDICDYLKNENLI